MQKTFLFLVLVSSPIVSLSVSAKTAREVAQIAVPATVRIDNPGLGPSASGSGAIISKSGNTYTVLTAAHVVVNPNYSYQIFTSKKKTYKVTSVVNLQKSSPNLDLAIVKFESADEQSIAPISNSDGTSIGSGIYISGYAQSIETEGTNEYEFTAGQVTSVRDKAKGGYLMRYDAVTRRGMSGGPVFDVDGRIVGIHGIGDAEGAVKESGGKQVSIKTGFNSAIPINSFVKVMPSTGLKSEDVTQDNAPPANVAAVQPTREEVKSWEQEFALAIGKSLLKKINLPFNLPF